MEDKHIKLTQIGRLNKQDENGVFSAGYLYINPNNILFLEEIREKRDWTYKMIFDEYEKDPNLSKLCWWTNYHYINKDEGYTDTPKKIIEYLRRSSTNKNPEHLHETCFVRHTKVNLITGNNIMAEESPEEIKKKINEYYEKEASNNENKIVVTKEDVVKNFIFKSFT